MTRIGPLLLIGALGTAFANGFGWNDGLAPWRQALFGVLLVGSFALGRTTSFPRPIPLIVASLGCCIALALFTGWTGLDVAASITGSVIAPWLAGNWLQQRGDLLKAREQQLRQSEQTRALEAKAARLAERERIARELHDVLGHDLALITLRAGAIELGADDITSERAAELRRSAMDATDRLRGSIGLLRGAVIDRPATELVEHARDAGLRIEARSLTDIDPAIDRLLGRIVQELITNAAKHAPSQVMNLVVDSDDCFLQLSASNRCIDPRSDPAEGGTGLRELERHLGELGGTLTVLRDEDFTVVAVLPRPAPGFS